MSRKIDMNVSLKDVEPTLLNKQPSAKERDAFQEKMTEWNAADPKTRGAAPKIDIDIMEAPEYVKSIIMNAISQSHKTGNTASLRRTKSIGEALEIGIDNKGALTLTDEDYKFVKSSLAKADQWNNVEHIAKSILVVEDLILDAEEE